MAFVNYERKDKIVTITINRPDRLNALNREVIAELDDAWGRFDNDPDAMVAIVTGSGKAFSSGMDITVLAQPHPAEDVAKLQSAQEHLRKVTKPIIAAINGLVRGAGLCLLVMECDIRIAAESATFGMPEITLALPAAPESFLAQGIPQCVAMELVLTGEPITAQRGYEIGLVNKVVPDRELMLTAVKIAERIAELPPRAVSLIKQAAAKALELSEERWNLTPQRIQNSLLEAQNSEEYQEAVRAFLEKRKPVFRGK